ncbi:MAG: hypothetical protein DCC72_03475, partial [Burkholderiales bacterium]
AEYSFEVEVVVPPDLRPGEAWLEARWEGGAALDVARAPLVILDEPPLSGEGSVVTFGPASRPTSTTTTSSPVTPSSVEAAGPSRSEAATTASSRNDEELWWLPALLAGFGVGAVVAGVVVVALCLRRRTSLVVAADDDATSASGPVDRRVLDGDRDHLG